MKIINEIIFNEKGNTICGELANKVYFQCKEKMKLLENEVISGKDKLLILSAKFWIIDENCKIVATQNSKDSAMHYMNDSRILLSKY